MTSPKSLLNIAGISLGSIGIAVCAASIIILWIVIAHLERASENLFTRMDRSLVVVRQRVVQTQDRVAAAATTTKEVSEILQDWTRREAGQQLALRLNAEEKTKQLVSTLQQADLWLEVSESSVGVAQELSSFRGPTSAPTDSRSFDTLIEEIASLRVQLAQATESIATIRERLAEASEAKSPRERIEQAIPVAMRVVAKRRAGCSMSTGGRS